MRALLANITAGFRIATFRSSSLSDFRYGELELAELTTLAVAAWLLMALAVGGELRTELLFDGTANLGAVLVVGVVLEFLLERPGLASRISVVLLSLAPFACAATAAIHLVSLDTASRLRVVLGAFYLSWTLIAHYRGLEVATGMKSREAIAVFGLYVSLSLVPPAIF
jgi:hypothetical protein